MSEQTPEPDEPTEYNSEGPFDDDDSQDPEVSE